MGAARQHVEQGLELWNNGDFDKLQALMAGDQTWISPSGTFTGSEAVIARFRSDLAAFPDRRITVSTWVEDGDTVAFEYELAGTHNGPLMLPDGSQLGPTGQHFTIRCADVIEVRGGKTVAQRTYYDQLPVMVQQGLVVPPQQP